MAYSALTPSIFIGAAGSYFADTRPDALMGRLQSVTLTEGVDANRPFQRFRNSRLDFEIIISAADAGERPYQAGQLVWLEVAAGAGAAEVWFKGLLRDPDYDVRRSGRSSMRMTAIDVSDVFKERISVASQSANTIAENIALLLDGVGWPDDADWRDIDVDLIEQLSTWEHDDRRAINGLQELADTTGPPARMVIKRNGGLQVIKDVSSTAEYSFDDNDVRNRPVVRQHEDSVINTVTIAGTTLGSVNTGIRNSRPLEYDVLDGLVPAERVNVIRRILRAYENGLTSLTFEANADDDRNQADIVALRPGTVIELDSDTLGQAYQGPISSLRWQWQRTRATVRINAEIMPPVVDITGDRLWATFSPAAFRDLLYLVDVETGLVSTIDVGDPGLNSITGLAFDRNTGTLWGADGPRLYDINYTTGVGTNVSDDSFVVFPATMNVRGMAFDPVNDVLYGVGIYFLDADDLGSERVITIDTTNGVGTLVPGNLMNLGDPQSLAFDPNSQTFYVAGRATGNVWELQKFSIPNPRIQSSLILRQPILNINQTFALAYDYDRNILYGELDAGIGFFDVATGAFTRIGTTDNYGLGEATELVGLTYGRLIAAVSQLDAPTGLALTEVGGDITANWDAVTDATDYVLEWREEGSGDAWQTADVSAPPHTFTP